MTYAKGMRIFIIAFTLLLTANIKNTSAQGYPLVTEIDGITVVIWTIEQDRQNSIKIERYNECDSLYQSIRKDLEYMNKIAVQDSLEHEKIMSAFQICESQLRDSKKNQEDCGKINEKLKAENETLEKKVTFWKVVTVAATVILIAVAI